MSVDMSLGWPCCKNCLKTGHSFVNKAEFLNSNCCLLHLRSNEVSAWTGGTDLERQTGSTWLVLVNSCLWFALIILAFI